MTAEDRRAQLLIEQWRRQAVALEFGAERMLTGDHAVKALGQAETYRACGKELAALLAIGDSK